MIINVFLLNMMTLLDQDIERHAIVNLLLHCSAYTMRIDLRVKVKIQHDPIWGGHFHLALYQYLSQLEFGTLD